MYSGQSPSTLPSPRMTVPRPSETGVEVAGHRLGSCNHIQMGEQDLGTWFLGRCPDCDGSSLDCGVDLIALALGKSVRLLTGLKMGCKSHSCLSTGVEQWGGAL